MDREEKLACLRLIRTPNIGPITFSLLFKVAGDYPARLAQFDDTTPVLSVRGSPHLLSRPSVGVVGARKASINAQRLAQSLAEDLATEAMSSYRALPAGLMPRSITARWPAAQWR